MEGIRVTNPTSEQLREQLNHWLRLCENEPDEPICMFADEFQDIIKHARQEARDARDAEWFEAIGPPGTVYYRRNPAGNGAVISFEQIMGYEPDGDGWRKRGNDDAT